MIGVGAEVRIHKYPGSYLQSAFVVHSGNNAGDILIDDSGAPCHGTHDGTRPYDLRPLPSGRKTITTGDRIKLKVECVGNMDAIFHNYTDETITLIDDS